MNYLRLAAMDLEKGLGRRVSAVAGPESLRQRLRRWARHEDFGFQRWAIFLLVHVIPLFLVLGLREKGELLAGAWLGTWWLGGLLVRTAELRNVLFEPRGDLFVEDNLPLSDQDVFDLHWDAYRGTSRERLAAAFLAGWVILGYSADFFALGVFAIGHWLVCGALTPGLVLRFSCSLLRKLGWTLLALAVVSLFAIGEAPLSRWETELNLWLGLLPTGWSIHVLRWLADPLQSPGLVAVLPVMLLLWLGRGWRAELRRQYVFREADPDLEWSYGAEWECESSIAVDDRVALLNPAPMEMGFGFLERTIHRWLSPKERVCVEAFGGFPLRITRGWWTSWAWTAGIVAVFRGLAQGDGSAGFYGLLGLALVLYCTVSPHQLLTRTREVVDPERGGALFHAGFPVDIATLMRIGWKGCVARTLASLPQLLVLGVFIAGTAKSVFGDFFAGGPTPSTWDTTVLWRGAELTLESICLILLVYPFAFMAEAINVSNPSRDAADKAVDIVVGVTVFGALCVSGGWVLYASNLFSTLAGLAAFTLATTLGFRYCRGQYQTGNIDLVRMPVE